MADVANMPNHILAWDDFTMSMDLDDAVLHELVLNRRTFFLPRLDLAGYPREFILTFQQWATSDRTAGTTVMRPLDWYVLLPAVNMPGEPVHRMGKRAFNPSLPH